MIPTVQTQAGFSPMDQSIHKGSRSSTSVAYLEPIRIRKNLTIATGCHVTRLLLKGTRVTGVEFQQCGDPKQVKATQEVIFIGWRNEFATAPDAIGYRSSRQITKTRYTGRGRFTRSW